MIATTESTIFVRRDRIIDGIDGRIVTVGLLAEQGDVEVNVPADPGVPPGDRRG
jgi:hypothetical protein